jgi:uncharacterized protein DUF3352
LESYSTAKEARGDVFCAHCGTDIGEAGRFCPACGAATAAAAPEPAPAPVASPPARSRPRWLNRRLLLGAVAVVAIVAAAAIAVSLVFGNAPEDHAIDLVPVDAAFYATVHLDPSLNQKQATQDVLDRAQDAGAGDGQSESIEDAIGAVVEEWTPADYERDVEPYAGDQMAFFVRAGEEPTVLAATEDPQASRQAMHRALDEQYPEEYFRIVTGSFLEQPYEYVVYDGGLGPVSGPSSFAVLGGFVVVGSKEDVERSIDARGGASLGDLEEYKDARDRLSDDILAFAYFDGESIAEEAHADEYADSDDLAIVDAVAGIGPVAATLAARDDSLDLDFAARASSGDAAPLGNPAALLETLPAEAIAAISLGDLGGPLRGVDPYSGGIGGMLGDAVAELAELELESDISPWLGQLGAYLSGEDEETVEGAVVAETRSPRESDRALEHIEDYYSSEYDYESSVYPSEDGLGFDVYGSDTTYQVRGDEDRVVAGAGAGGFSTERALDAAGGFGESDLYGRAAGLLGGYEPFLAIDAAPAQSLLEDVAELQYDETYVDDVRRWVSSLETVAAGVRREGDGIRIRLALEVGGG